MKKWIVVLGSLSGRVRPTTNPVSAFFVLVAVFGRITFAVMDAILLEIAKDCKPEFRKALRTLSEEVERVKEVGEVRPDPLTP
ncbi:hypothetical protein [Geotalea uraniireducens]|uniref:hypothetical protein n=1 Tax=Geotalea uraniireducens TaxID=351604 RepID=UPI0012EDD627|nr:hypothetical protein [Geotalea uraniireducens]